MVQAAEVTVWEEVKQADVIKVAMGREVEDYRKSQNLTMRGGDWKMLSKS